MQTGDGRVMAEGAFTYAPLPLPFAWMVDGDQHIDLSEMAPQIGTVEEIAATDAGGLVPAWGYIDDEIPAGAELIRRMEAGTAAHGAQQFVSVDPDNWALDILLAIDDDEAADEVGIIASLSSGRLPSRVPTFNLWDVRRMVANLPGFRLVAAAGDPDPGTDSTEYMLLFHDDVDEVLFRFTRLRIRGLTCCAVSAFDGALIELDPEPVAAGAAPPPRIGNADGRASDALAAHSAPALDRQLVVPDRPADEVFDEPGAPDGSLNLDDYRLSGYVATWGTCHVGYPTECQPPPEETDAEYPNFRHGIVETESGAQIRTGALTWGIPHADLDADLMQAFAHYADSHHAFADVTVGMNEHGIWHAGALRPASQGTDPLTRDDVRVLRALSLSGDWRWDFRSRSLSMIAALAVNHPGFPVPRIVAAAGAAARRSAHVTASPAVQFDPAGEHPMALVAAGIVAPADSPFGVLEASACSCHSTAGELAAIRRTLRQLEVRTRSMVGPAVQDRLASIRRR